VPAVFTTAGVNVAVPTDAGSPPSDSATSPVKPLSDASETVKFATAPALTVCVDGAADSVKSCGAGTTRVAVAVCVAVPLVPVIVSG